MAIKALSWMVRLFEPPVYCYHEIVHNQLVVEHFTRLGVVFVDDVDEVPDGAPLMLSAHGTAPAVEAAAAERGRTVVDSACPLVTKVHHELKVRAGKGYTVLYVGHEGHEEAVGTMAVAPEAVRLVSTPKDVDAVEDPGTPIALLAQTTLSHEEWSDVLDRARELYPELWMPGRSDLCYATTNRQKAMRVIAPQVDVMIVIGSANSSNTRALERVARTSGCETVYRVDRAGELPEGISGVVGVTAGASAPESLVAEVIELLSPTGGVETVDVLDEDEYFPPPRELRELVRAIALAAAGAVGGEAGEHPLAGDRVVAADSFVRFEPSLAG
jgi:4-hydroxy-3-methylbut-2-en-1-yl diphosphate reductase